MSEVKKLKGLIYDTTSEWYHGVKGVYSSSQLKDLLDDEQIFHRKYILKTEEKEHIPAFDIGNYFHTSILEPHKIASETAVYGSVRRGKEWEKFQADNKGKVIITASEMEQAKILIASVKNSPVAMNRIARGEPEVSAFVDVIVSCGEIFSEDGRKLGKYGWEQTKEKPDKKNRVVIPLKVRADSLGDDFILDLKSTTGNARSKISMARKISDYTYDLSASLYLDLFTIAKNKVMSDFIWTFASKDYGNCQNYTATQKNVMVGRAKWKKAVLKLSYCISSNWEFQDYMDTLDPQPFEEAILQTRGEDLL